MKTFFLVPATFQLLMLLCRPNSSCYCYSPGIIIDNNFQDENGKNLNSKRHKTLLRGVSLSPADAYDYDYDYDYDSSSKKSSITFEDEEDGTAPASTIEKNVTFHPMVTSSAVPLYEEKPPPFEITTMSSTSTSASSTTRSELSLSTTFTGAVPAAGNMFDVLALTNITIHSFDLHTSSTDASASVCIYFRKGTHQGYQRRPGAWKQIVDGNVQGRGFGVATSVPTTLFSELIRMDTTVQNSAYAFYITLFDAQLLCSVGSFTGSVLASNVDLVLYEGVSSGFEFTSVVSARVWNGNVHYTVDDDDPPIPTVSLSTTFAGGAAHHGSMFDVIAMVSGMSVCALSVHTSSNLGTLEDVQVYTKNHSYQGYHRRPSAWNLVGEEEIEGNGVGLATALPDTTFEPIVFESIYDRKAFYVTFTNSVMLSTMGTAEGAIYVQNADLQIMEGIGKSNLFRNAFAPRVWNGAIHYTLPGMTVAPTIKVTHAPTMSPSMSVNTDAPTLYPSKRENASDYPTLSPSVSLSSGPSSVPTHSPTTSLSSAPSSSPQSDPISDVPTQYPTNMLQFSNAPSSNPTAEQTSTTSAPTVQSSRICAEVLANYICSSDNECFLVGLFEALDGCSWRNRNGWLDNHDYAVDDHFCSWLGVSCANIDNSTEITEINLSYNNLIGMIPSTIGGLVFLTQIDISRNGVYGVVPSELGNLSSLEVLNLASNGYNNVENSQSGIIPAELCSMRSDGELQVLAADCSYPFFVDCTTNDGTVRGNCCNYCENSAPSTSPSAVPSLTLVPTFDPTVAPTTALPTDVPSEAPIMPSAAPTCKSTVSNFTCEGYNLASTCKVLIELYESLNGCNWLLGNENGSSLLPNTSAVWFSGTPTGGLIDPFCSWFGITCEDNGCTVGCDVIQIDLFGNNLSGALPNQLNKLFKLETLQLSDNNIGGTIPTQLGQLPNLQVVTLSENNLSGAYDNGGHEICDLGLTTFILDCDDNWEVSCECCTSCGTVLAPSESPSQRPTYTPSMSPTASTRPSDSPTAIPTYELSGFPTVTPSVMPSLTPTIPPSTTPTISSSVPPSIKSSVTPSTKPSVNPSVTPSVVPTNQASNVPTSVASDKPSNSPSESSVPSQEPSQEPSPTPTEGCYEPTNYSCTNDDPLVGSIGASYTCILDSAKTACEITACGGGAAIPAQVCCGCKDRDVAGNVFPSRTPSLYPSVSLSASPTLAYSYTPSSTPSVTPSINPSSTPSTKPSVNPSVTPSLAPSITPSISPSSTSSTMPSINPSVVPTNQASNVPTSVASEKPSSSPSEFT